MRQSIMRGLVFLVSSAVALVTCVQAQAGHWVWQFEGIHSGWVYVPDDSDNSAYTWNGESSGPSMPPARPAAQQPSLHDYSASMIPRPVVSAQQIQAEQGARIRYNQAQLNQGNLNFKPTLLSNYRRP